MLKAGFITLAMSMVIVAILSYFLPFGAICAVIVLGVAAGYIAGALENPRSNTAAIKKGTLAASIGGIGAMVGVGIGRGLFGFLSGPQGARDYWSSVGAPITSSEPEVVQFYWIGLVTSMVCFSIIDIIFMAGSGALGGILWWQIKGKNTKPPISS